MRKKEDPFFLLRWLGKETAGLELLLATVWKEPAEAKLVWKKVGWEMQRD